MRARVWPTRSCMRTTFVKPLEPLMVSLCWDLLNNAHLLYKWALLYIEVYSYSIITLSNWLCTKGIHPNLVLIMIRPILLLCIFSFMLSASVIAQSLQWKRINPATDNRPPPRRYSAMAWGMDALYLFGGQGQNGSVLGLLPWWYAYNLYLEQLYFF